MKEHFQIHLQEFHIHQPIIDLNLIAAKVQAKAAKQCDLIIDNKKSILFIMFSAAETKVCTLSAF